MKQRMKEMVLKERQLLEMKLKVETYHKLVQSEDNTIKTLTRLKIMFSYTKHYTFLVKKPS